MAHAPFSGDFESLARQYWNTWNELLGRGGGSSDPWSLMGGMPPGLGRVDPGSFDWYGRMQRLAADFSGGGQAGDIAQAWRDMLGGQGADPYAGMLRSMHGGLAGGDWVEQIRPMLDMLLRPVRQQGSDWLQRPAFGPAREHQERLQALALAWQEWEQRNEAFNAILGQAGQGAFERFEQLLREHDAPGKRLESARALFDLWIDAAEQAWAEIAISVEYRHAYAEMTNALMRLRLGLQREVEQFGTMLGLPGRGEVDALHRKVADLERSLHAARRASAAAQRQPAGARKAAAATPATSEASTAGTVAGSDDSVATTRRKPVRKGAAARRTPNRRADPDKPSSKKRASKRPARKAPAVAAKRAPRAAVARAAAAPATVRGKAVTKPGPATATPAGKRVARKPVAKKAPASAAPPRAAVAANAAKAAKVGKAGKAAKVAKVAKVAKAAAPRAVAKAGKASRDTARKPQPAASDSARKRPKPPENVAAATSAPAPATAKVVSMKDWVSRNLATTANEDAASSASKAGGKRGGRNR